eukprot:TRINITY_DN12183_c0_g1_i1.p1 TRINITY_DN12183_c0_g1~~TRINITY_DN12183_c0_g1_i1.p1  ORF type:complete len:242 (+),score=42.35 TRINITY_DN12183_c0_g1_i1:106-831(+)
MDWNEWANEPLNLYMFLTDQLDLLIEDKVSVAVGDVLRTSGGGEVRELLIDEGIISITMEMEYLSYDQKDRILIKISDEDYEILTKFSDYIGSGLEIEDLRGISWEDNTFRVGQRGSSKILNIQGKKTNVKSGSGDKLVRVKILTENKLPLIKVFGMKGQNKDITELKVQPLKDWSKNFKGWIDIQLESIFYGQNSHTINLLATEIVITEIKGVQRQFVIVDKREGYMRYNNDEGSEDFLW